MTMGREAALWFLAGCAWVVVALGVQRTTAWLQSQHLPSVDDGLGLAVEVVFWPLSVAIVAVVGVWAIGRLLSQRLGGPDRPLQ
jgi:hypothetical protein